MPKHYSLIATAILANYPTYATTISALSYVEAQGNFADSIDYIKYSTENDFTF